MVAQSNPWPRSMDAAIHASHARAHGTPSLESWVLMLKPLAGKPAFAFPVIAAAPGIVACTKYLEGKQTPGAKQLYFWSRRIPIIECECCVSEIRLLTPQVHVHVIRDVTLAEIKVSLV